MLIVVFALALPFAMQDTPERHVRATERSILALISLQEIGDRDASAAHACEALAPGGAASRTVDQPARSPHNHLTGQARMVLETLMTGVRQRLSRPECRKLFTDFVDRDGHTLASILDRSGRTPAEYLGHLYYVDASTSAHCRSDQIWIAFTAPTSRVIYLCSRRLIVYFSNKTSSGEILIIHELLHALGLGENPPASEHITDRVWARCGSPERNDRERNEIAHEVAHLIIPQYGHSSEGLMKAVWDVRDYLIAAQGRLRFSDEQAALIRAALAL